MSDVTDWIGAVGTAAGAIGTAGAFWLGAVAYRQQARDQHRAQAAAVTVGQRLTQNGIQNDDVVYFIRNDSSLPIYNAVVYTGPLKARREHWMNSQVLPPGEEIYFVYPGIQRAGFTAIGKFIDASGNGWRRDGLSGALEPIKAELGHWENLD